MREEIKYLASVLKDSFPETIIKYNQPLNLFTIEYSRIRIGVSFANDYLSMYIRNSTKDRFFEFKTSIEDLADLEQFIPLAKKQLDKRIEKNHILFYYLKNIDEDFKVLSILIGKNKILVTDTEHTNSTFKITAEGIEEREND